MAGASHINVVIVGAGLGGLSAAIALARGGHQVTIVEQTPKLGEVSTSTKALVISANRCKGYCGYTSSSKLIPYSREMGNTPKAKEYCHVSRIHCCTILP
jgi:NADPH-dependent 2,4-dienoyl-CoA reductase/sulfur reductase-like enzyme